MPASHFAHVPVSVVFASNDYYAPYLSALLASILDHCSKSRAYEFIVLSEDFGNVNARVLQEQVEQADVDASLRFLDVNTAMRPYEGKLQVHGHFKRETYFRLLLPQLLPNHAKVLYLDADMICLRDVAELFDTDVTGYLVAACKDPDTTGIYNGVERDLGQPDKHGYMDNVLGIKNPYEYFQAGTMLFNLVEWRSSIDVDEVFAFAQKREWQLLDQDVLNYFCQGHVRFVNMAWNVMFDLEGFRIADIISKTTPELKADYFAARENPHIVHYAGPTKPWDDPECDFAWHFWTYARKTPLYEVILDRMLHKRDAKIEQLRRDLQTTQEFIMSVDAELMRYEHRSLGLIFKEIMYQKVIMPVVDLLTGDNEDTRGKIRGAYRRVHPRRQ